VNFPFPKTRRILKGWEYDKVFRTGARVKGRLVRLLYLREGEGFSRVGVVAGKRQGGAVFRNRSKRKLREAVRRILPWIEDGYLIVVSLTHTGYASSAKEIYMDMACSMSKSGLLNPSYESFRWDIDREED